ncbi:CRISPR-associated endonuclease Cas1 [Baekduia soli]|uniref:CRISPR-associated endonuclease Cas1 n=1 Tax=Baekduia soli TaxID=496014 RepID=A0A5B8U6H9_9ACTN|nr:CRISPR-associated endonuclease Cas1 [Baekduia soli]QEC48541.1 CRISPR-associated endonuclease Cas1 [Baekduia soli]
MDGDTPPTERPEHGVIVAAGYGLRLYVRGGHLIVHDGVGRQHRTRRYHRAISKLRRVVVIGHDGYITLEAMRWIRDIGAAFVQVDRDANLIALSAPARHHESALRRAQVLAGEQRTGRQATVDLLRAKLELQAQIAERLSRLKATVRIKDAHPITVAAAIRESAESMHADLSYAVLRQLESAAGRNYWQTWARVSVEFDPGWDKRIPDHWREAGPRTSAAENKGRGRKATTPVHAMLNYTYAILETEATIAAHKLGFDPSLGLMHTDKRYRGSLATDLMEPARPAADLLVLDFLECQPLRRGDVRETREGVVRIGAPLARQLAAHSSSLLAAVAPHAEQLARTLLGRSDHPTPLTRRRHAAAIAQTRSDTRTATRSEGSIQT